MREPTVTYGVLEDEGRFSATTDPIPVSKRWPLSRRDLMRVAWLLPAGWALNALLPRQALAATNFLYEGAGAYGVAVANILTTQLNSLASSSGNTLSTVGSSIQNTTARLYADVEFVAGGTFTPTAGAFVELWLLRSLDGGSNYEDGSSSAAPGRPADITALVRAGTTITPRAGASGLRVHPGFAQPIARNQTGASFPASGNLIRWALYTVQY